MTDKTLMEKVSRLGLPLMETNEEFDVNQTLAEVVKSRDARLLEGFPVLLLNSQRDSKFNYERVSNNLTEKEQETFRALLLLSLTLYQSYHLSFSWMNKLKNKFSDEERSELKQLRNWFVHNDSFVYKGSRFDATRLKKMFELYYEKDAEKNRQKKESYESLSFEYSLSQMFSPKQKELFKKKLEGLPLTKTEAEYFSRTVKKKLAALANSELHRTARRLLQQR
jgi:hypothetical protein